MSRGAARYPKVRTEDEMILGEPIRDGSDDPIVARGEGEIVTLASEPRKPPPTVIDPFVAKKQRVLTQALGYNPRTRTVPIPDNHPPRNLASTFMKALKVHKIDYEIFNTKSFRTRKFDSTQQRVIAQVLTNDRSSRFPKVCGMKC